MSHWYIGGRLFGEDHPQWETLEPWPRTKAGLRAKRVSWTDRLAAGLKPSVTTWLSAIKGDSVDGLMGFSTKIGRDVGMCMTDRWPYEMREQECAKTYFWAEYRKRRDEYSETGTRIHRVIEDYLKGNVKGNDIEMGVVEARAATNAYGFLLEHDIYEAGAAEYVVEGTDYAGTVDWHVPRMQTIVDWKTIRHGEGKPVRKPYPSELAQVAAYWHALYDEPFTGEGWPACCVYISQRTGEILNVAWWTKEDIACGMKLFRLGQDVTRMLKMIEATFS